MVIISWISELIELLPEIIFYIAYGYIFLFFYQWVTLKDSKDAKNIIITSIVLNYVLITLYTVVFNIINIQISNTVIVYSILSAVLGLLIGKLVLSEKWNDVLKRFKLGRTVNKNIWDDILQDGVWLHIYLKDGSSYLGQYSLCEEYKRYPIVVLKHYQYVDCDNNMVYDYFDNPYELVMLNTNDFEKIHVTTNVQKSNEIGCEIGSKYKE